MWASVVSIALSAAGWLVKNLLPAILAHRWGKASAQRDAMEAANEVRQKANSAMHAHLDMSEPEFYDWLQSGSRELPGSPTLDTGTKSLSGPGNAGNEGG